MRWTPFVIFDDALSRGAGAAPSPPPISRLRRGCWQAIGLGLVCWCAWPSRPVPLVSAPPSLTPGHRHPAHGQMAWPMVYETLQAFIQAAEAKRCAPRRSDHTNPTTAQFCRIFSIERYPHVLQIIRDLWLRYSDGPARPICITRRSACTCAAWRARMKRVERFRPLKLAWSICDSFGAPALHEMYNVGSLTSNKQQLVNA